MSSWPLVIVIKDYFVPQLAQIVTEVSLEHDSEVCGLVWKFAAERAREGLSGERLN